MGRYADWADVVGRYPDAAKIADAGATGSYWLQYAEAEVDARLAVKYTVPFTPTPLIVTDLVIDLTYYKMTMRQKGSNVIKESLDERFEGVIAGTIVVAGTDGTVAGAGVLTWSDQNQPGYHSAFGMDDSVNWSPSAAIAADNEADRE